MKTIKLFECFLKWKESWWWVARLTRQLLSVVETAGAEAGLFVPSKQSYVQRKMRRLELRREVLSKEAQLNMLLTMCEEDKRLCVDCCEYGEENWAQTFEMLEAVQ